MAVSSGKFRVWVWALRQILQRIPSRPSPYKALEMKMLACLPSESQRRMLPINYNRSTLRCWTEISSAGEFKSGVYAVLMVNEKHGEGPLVDLSLRIKQKKTKRGRRAQVKENCHTACWIPILSWECNSHWMTLNRRTDLSKAHFRKIAFCCYLEKSMKGAVSLSNNLSKQRWIEPRVTGKTEFTWCISGQGF